ncbi:uncharacterized protein K460DRAFT_326270 [Cucurbitaria berberidis CBS 394.84]|uniref:Zn(2)-C6 fungal-type domain-containing protein n=1 Tax=Cucurbitaria berberidis CBS 394.84 TaxID=1168544 RepID=A0A9P4LD13_9PLEO|nr:uncharacterized protein K460DRAFT_326270 [Cucurbitaria berberidis CBS 394.84]KAF1849922.1 hypothetical protein K460DRAFT_326270 [Cucurbitaria berberidis CBS 394.84]
MPLLSMLSPQNRSMQDSSSSDSPTLSDGRTESAPSLPRKPIPRKGHTKSRRGCFNCKRRRIKCNEKHPECNHCIKAGLQCKYPANIIQSMQRSPTPPHPQEVANLRSTPGMFSMADMRLFHHFLITAYPHLPVGADKIWITVIPSFAHNYEYLIHSILALAASHLDAVSSSSVAEQALQHRILAVKSLNDALSVPPKTRCERDARMAAALALAFQSSHLQDGMAEFLTMVRGCNLIAGDEAVMNADSAFHAFREDGHLQTMRNRIDTSQLNYVNQEDLDLAAMSLREIEVLNLSDWERTYWNILVRTVDNAYERPVEAYTTFVLLYNTPSRWTHDEFQAFIDPNNSVAQILLAHFIAIQAILTPILYLERVGFQGVDAPTAVLSWIEGIYRNVPRHLRHHAEWPRQVSRYPFMRFLGQKQMDFYEEDLLLI